MPSVLDVESIVLSSLQAREAVTLFAKILRAEAVTLNIPGGNISITEEVLVADGGVDALVQAGSITPIGAILSGTTAYQIKAGDTFSPQQKGHVEKELFVKGRTTEYDAALLKPHLKKALDDGASYALVSFGVDLTAEKQGEAVEHIKNALTECGYPDTKVVVWTINQIKGFISRFPSLAFELNGIDSIFHTHEAWSREDLMRHDFVRNDVRAALITELQNDLKDTSSKHIVVLGEPGIGKTKFVLEATADVDIVPLVLYTDDTDGLTRTVLYNKLRNGGEGLPIVLVVDETTKTEGLYIWDQLKNSRASIRLVTISNEPSEYHDTRTCVIPPLGEDEAKKVFEQYGFQPDDVRRWVELCGGFPRVAHVIATNLSRKKKNLLSPPDSMSEVWDDFVVGADDKNSPAVKERVLCLEHIALFKKFGGPEINNGEFEALLAFIKKADPTITDVKLKAVLKDLSSRKIIQGKATHYITPKALHIKLWQDYWEKYGAIDIENFLPTLSGNLPEWFAEMFKYAAESQVASEMVERLLGPEGPYKDDAFLRSKLGTGFFLALTEANPEAALEALERIIPKWTAEEVSSFKEGRQSIVWSLEKMAIWGPLFVRAAKVLQILAVNETDSRYSNNSRGTFAGLFSLGYGAVATSEAKPENRLPVLVDCLKPESSQELKLLALEACDSALQTSFTKALGAEQQGLRPEPGLWMPKTYGELYDAYRAIIGLVVETATINVDEVRTAAVTTLTDHASQLAQIPSISNEVLSALRTLASLTDEAKQEVLKTVLWITKHAHLLPEVSSKWSEFSAELEGGDFDSQFKRYVGVDVWSEDEKKLREKIDGFATQILQQPNLLDNLWPWLMSEKAKNPYLLGFYLGKHDSALQMLPKLTQETVASAERLSPNLLAGYLAAAFENDVSKWEEIIKNLATNKAIVRRVPDLICRSGISENATNLVTRLIRDGAVPLEVLAGFTFGGLLDKVSDATAEEWISLLIADGGRYSASIALHIFNIHYIFQKNRELPGHLAFAVLTNPGLFQEERGGADTMDDYYWTETVKKIVSQDPGYAMKLVDIVFPALAKEEGLFSTRAGRTAHEALLLLAKTSPNEAWAVISKLLEDEEHFPYRLLSWLRGGWDFERDATGAVDALPREKIFEWIDEKPEERASLLVRYVPKDIFDVTETKPILTEIVEKYGHHESVIDHAISNFFNEGWSGGEGHHYRKRLELVLELKKRTTNANMLKLLSKYEAALKESAERGEMRDERRW